MTCPSWVLHVDSKAAGPRDDKPEVVAEPNQLSGAGELDADANPANRPFTYTGRTAAAKPYSCHPRLPPLYLTGPDDQARPCISAFIKATYQTQAYGRNRIIALDLAVIPNGLLLFGPAPRYSAKGLFAPGKCDSSVPLDDRRVRVLFAARAALDGWRLTRLQPDGAGRWRPTRHPAV